MRPLLISEDDEIKLGNSFKAQILSDTREYPQYNGNQAVIRFVDSVGQYLASVQDERPNLPFTFTILDKDEINAFAIPGGHIFVYTGLLRNIESTSELAGVLAHEIAHITLYHGVN
ncbi:MAG: M48 family metalloprotease, partial [Clostridiaceae bacterium]|nr:M48 family metalloprotease [Clostridiaceae bacterium]